MNRIVILVVLALALVVGGMTVEHSGAASTTTLELAVDGAHATRTLVDAAPRHTRNAPNDSPGDTIVLHAPLLDGQGSRVGVIDATFLTTAVGTSLQQDGSEQLAATLRLRDGDIAVLGNVASFARVTHVAVIGGTGRYADARGDITALFSPRAVKLHVSLR